MLSVVGPKLRCRTVQRMSADGQSGHSDCARRRPNMILIVILQSCSFLARSPAAIEKLYHCIAIGWL
jgi:hypothetical protein